ncbi:HIT family hydrolase [Acinetobacter baumannii]|nr:HIT family hydrolase [Acinetobacter baumannii]
MTDKKCPYCDFDEYDIIDKNEFAVILPDPNPLSKGHCVVTPLRHVSSFF